ncbi:solute carrier family 2, facilitated glucose transporter member 3-like isoform X1 [Mytilus californianus]|uniref:solute carrier family 2, facilitated glucose transporter member 3-like isoform X1 n=3 Tax=Mytilus californianus TaxID=6549 RepID=UPI002247C274|nr:solute carrier family 2, facilitated glucose transporter member 3-like isoform X1 [Mytilus californianus]
MEKRCLLSDKNDVSVDQSKLTRIAILESSREERIDAVVIMDEETSSGFNGRLAFSIASCVLGASFTFGYNTGVVNTAEGVIKDFYNRTYESRDGKAMEQSTMTLLWSFTVAAFALGGMIGGFSAGYFCNKYGRKGTLLRNNLLNLLGGLLMMFSDNAKSYEMLIAGRLVIGICAGIFTGAAPLYLSEIAPISLRGFAGVFNQLAITFGVMISEILGLQFILGTAYYWKYAVGMTIVPMCLQLCTLIWCPESPRYLMLLKSDEESAEKALKWLRNKVDVSDEIEEMRIEGERMRKSKKFSITDLFHHKELLTPLIIGLVMQLSQQWGGINAVIYYSTEIFEGAGLSKASAQYATVGVGGVNVAMTFVSALIMDRAGRRTLHLIGLGGMFVGSVVLTIGLEYQSHHKWLSYLCIVAVVLYIIFFATGPGSIPWFIVAELFDQQSRSAAVSLAVLTNWFANFCVALGYPEMNTHLKQLSFVPFVCLLFFFWLFTFFKVPETKGRSIEEIRQMFQQPINVSSDDGTVQRGGKTKYTLIPTDEPPVT